MLVEKFDCIVYNISNKIIILEYSMALKINKYDILKILKHFFFVALGTLILAFGTAVFLVEYDLVTGGVSGFAIVLNEIWPNSEDFYITVLTWGLFLLGWIFLGHNFAAKTLLSTILYPFMYMACRLLVDPDLNLFNGYFIIHKAAYQDIAVFIAATLGGACVGVGCALAFKGGGSTGGVDVIAFLVCKIFKKLKSSYVIFAIDATIITLGIFVIQDMVLSLLGIVSAFLCALMIDKVFLGNDGAYVAQIVSDEYEIISKGIIRQLDRTATIVDVMGAYSKQPKKMLIVSFSMREYSDLVNIINHADPGAFMTVTRAHENHGEGWTTEKK